MHQLLLGARVSEDLVHDIKREVSDFEGVHGVFDIILHNYGPNALIGSLHINVNDTMDAHEIHDLTRQISEQMYDRHSIIMTVGVYAIAGENRRAIEALVPGESVTIVIDHNCSE